MIMNLTMKHFILTLALLLSVAAALAQPARRGAPKTTCAYFMSL